MCSIKKFSVLVVAILCLHTATGQKNQTANYKINWKKVNILVYTKNGKGYVHENIAAASEALLNMGKQYGFNVDTSSDPKIFTEEGLKKYSLLIFNNTNNEVFETDGQKVALMRYVQAGGGFVGLHSATGTERQWPWFKRLIGASFLRHANHQPFKEIIIDADHPSTSFLPKVWDRDDECYFFKEFNPDIRVLIVHDLGPLNDKDKPAYYGGTSSPSVWCHQFDGGRQWYTSLGHDAPVYATKEFQQHILGGIVWVIGPQKPLDYSKAKAKSPDDPLPY